MVERGSIFGLGKVVGYGGWGGGVVRFYFVGSIG